MFRTYLTEEIRELFSKEPPQPEKPQRTTEGMREVKEKRRERAIKVVSSKCGFVLL